MACRIIWKKKKTYLYSAHAKCINNTQETRELKGELSLNDKFQYVQQPTAIQLASNKGNGTSCKAERRAHAVFKFFDF